ncbi:2-deoxyribonucleoside glycosidase [Geotalea uraniireducens]|uniref:2-deoxyribonucleoside glycosidase n=1 Tax=Geotalea uraniireducens TaxID=351604 RepID=A0ABN6VYS9_9BACT|nr:nucleoside 2-deoxyribosyltransferase [Geotalea uraniireducens]BDV43770.1 2-deoxyribonucleoside glycosidase [Geotalea uraniireducens]
MSGNSIYLASPLGFSPENRDYLGRVKNCLAGFGYSIFDPWQQNQFDGEIARARALTDVAGQVAAFRRLAAGIGRVNEEGIRAATLVFAILDGAELDSGTASEVGFGAALGKSCYGLRTDLRDSGDFAGVPINLQVLHFIERSGGRLFRSIGEIVLP